MSRSADFNALVEDVLKELEYELESEIEGEFYHPPPLVKGKRVFKWTRFVPDGAGWKVDIEESSTYPMSPAEAHENEEKVLAKWSRQMGKKPFAYRRCIWGGKAWQEESDPMPQCKIVDPATGSQKSCSRPKPAPCECVRGNCGP